jgi:hypothetical protein
MFGHCLLLALRHDWPITSLRLRYGRAIYSGGPK